MPTAPARRTLFTMPSASNKSPSNSPAVRASGYPLDRPDQIRPGVRFAEKDFPWSGKNSVPAKGDKTARHGEIEDSTDYGGVVKGRTFMKGGKK